MRQKLSAKLSKNLWNKLKIYFFILLISLSLFFILVLFNTYFQVRDILIIGNNSTHQLTGIENLKNRNIFFLSTNEIEKFILNNNPQIKTVTTNKVYPKTIILTLVNYEPIADLKLNKGYAILANDGKILAKSEKKDNLPQINYYQQFDFYQTDVGSSFDYKELKIALFLLEKAQDLDLKIESIDINGLNMIVFNLKDKKIFFTSEKSKEDQEFDMETVVKQFKIEAKDFKILDLRFDKPVVSF